MSESDKVFAGSIPESYDRYLVPLIFENFAEDAIMRAEIAEICCAVVQRGPFKD